MIVVAVAMFVANADVDRLEVGPLRIEISRPAREIGLDDPLALDVTVQHPTNVTVEPPAAKAGTMFDSALVTQLQVDGPDPIDGPFGRVQVQNWRIALEPTKVGPLTLPKLKFRYQEKGKASTPAEISLPSFEVKPGGIAAGPNAKLELPPPLPERNKQDFAWWMKTVGGSALAVCLIALIVSAMKTKSPADETRTAIESASGNPRQAISQICDAVRAYLQKAHGVSAAHLTTPELLGDEELLSALADHKARSARRSVAARRHASLSPARTDGGRSGAAEQSRFASSLNSRGAERCVSPIRFGWPRLRLCPSGGGSNIEDRRRRSFTVTFRF